MNCPKCGRSLVSVGDVQACKPCGLSMGVAPVVTLEKVVEPAGSMTTEGPDENLQKDLADESVEEAAEAEAGFPE